MSHETLSPEGLDNKLLQSVNEMKAEKTAQVSSIKPSAVTEARKQKAPIYGASRCLALCLLILNGGPCWT